MKTEGILTLGIIITLILKYLHLPGLNILFIIILINNAVIYFFLAFYLFCDKIIARQNLVLSIASGILLSIVPLGILFKLMYWNGGQLYLKFGTLAAIIIFAISLFLKSKAPEHLQTYYKNMLLRTRIMIFVTVLLYLIPTTTLLNIEYRNDPELARLKGLYYINPANLEYKKQLNEYLLKRDSLKLK